MSRHKDIMYSSRTRQNTNTYARVHMLKQRLVEALKRIPEEERKPEEDVLIMSFETAGVVNIVHLIYQHKEYEGQAKDYDFSGTSMREHWESGYEDMLRT